MKEGGENQHVSRGGGVGQVGGDGDSRLRVSSVSPERLAGQRSAQAIGGAVRRLQKSLVAQVTEPGSGGRLVVAKGILALKVGLHLASSVEGTPLAQRRPEPLSSFAPALSVFPPFLALARLLLYPSHSHGVYPRLSRLCLCACFAPATSSDPIPTGPSWPQFLSFLQAH